MAINLSDLYKTSLHIVLTACLALAVPSCVDSGEETDTAESALLLSCACPAETPAILAPPLNQNLAFVLDATGVQQYACKATATGAAWSLVAPAADLLKNDAVVGTHYAGPTWEYNDGSTVVGAKAQSATVDSTAIPWLLLSVVSNSGPWLSTMSNVTAIQRLETTGGLAPSAGCTAELLGGIVEVPYTAKYYFYRTNNLLPQLNTRCGAN
ncbi:MAG TPA: DUF3455 domain-containing protein [Kofleriaceae bacterium]|nr:DUF3455 domain-containing protein [Kofleriaceae bacterium]